jgi:replicative DNA helicase
MVEQQTLEVNTPAITAEAMELPEGLRLLTLSALLGDWEADAAAVYEAMRTGQPRGPVTGLPNLDKALNGTLEPGLHVVHGEPGTGKTAFVLQVAAECQFPCLYVTCDMSPLELLRRIAARVTSTPLGKFKSGELSPQDSMTRANQAVRQIGNLSILDAAEAYAEPKEIRKVAERIQGNARRVLIVVDSVHDWVDSWPTGLDERETLNAALASLKRIAHKLDSPVLAVAERNRASMSSGGLSASAGTRKFEYGAQTVFDLKADDDEQENANGERPVKVSIAKNRNGIKGRKIELLFHGAFQRFREADR